MKISRMISAVAALFAALAFTSARADNVKASEEYPEFYNGDSAKGIDFVQSIKVLAPRYCSNVKGDVTVVFEAKGMTRVLARCWSGEGEWGKDAVLADVKLDARSRGEFVFHADRYPAGLFMLHIIRKKFYQCLINAWCCVEVK